jgi:hypothetical protein
MTLADDHHNDLCSLCVSVGKGGEREGYVCVCVRVLFGLPSQLYLTASLYCAKRKCTRQAHCVVYSDQVSIMLP